MLHHFTQTSFHKSALIVKNYTIYAYACYKYIPKSKIKTFLECTDVSEWHVCVCVVFFLLLIGGKYKSRLKDKDKTAETKRCS